jgi:hypothetical protein
MTLSTEKILQLAQADETTAQLVLTIDLLADAVKNLSARVKKLEESEQEKKTVTKIRAV